MPMYAKGGGEAFGLPEGIYILKLVEVVEYRTFENEKRPDTPDVSMTLQFEVDDPDDEFHGTQIRAFFSKTYTGPNTRTGKLVTAMFGGIMPEAFTELDEEEDDDGNLLPTMIGKRFRATVKVNEKGYNTIEAPLPIRQRRPQPTPAQRAQLDAPYGGEPPF